ncbi:MAG: class I SAM-dependent methyltransferase [Phyllobacteriaceae bacterium]|nr:class I SAM-dependent methyltransferase [Phyllobacteriaceae bacterium]
MIPFYDLSLTDRVALTETAFREKRTLIERWRALEPSEAQPWNRRAAKAAEFLQDQPSVADFGCGTMNLEHHLRPDQIYVPLDVVARDDRTLVCDLNLQPPPETGATAAAFLGVLEYLFDPPGVLQEIARRYRVLVVSYCITDAPNAPTDRRQHAWVNDFSEADILNLFERSGWRPEQSGMIDQMQKLWRLTTTAAV